MLLSIWFSTSSSFALAFQLQRSQDGAEHSHPRLCNSATFQRFSRLRRQNMRFDRLERSEPARALPDLRQRLVALAGDQAILTNCRLALFSSSAQNGFTRERIVRPVAVGARKNPVSAPDAAGEILEARFQRARTGANLPARGKRPPIRMSTASRPLRVLWTICDCRFPKCPISSQRTPDSALSQAGPTAVIRRDCGGCEELERVESRLHFEEMQA